MDEFASYLTGFLTGHAVASLIVLAILFLAFQWFTGFPLRWGWRRHKGVRIGKLLPPKNDRDA
jgi:type IV secretory pathway VirB2 component (pilin)